MAHMGRMPLPFALKMASKAAEERQTQAAWEMYVATAPWAGKDAPTFAEYLDKIRKGGRRDLRRAQMSPEEISAKFEAIVAADLRRAGREGGVTHADI